MSWAITAVALVAVGTGVSVYGQVTAASQARSIGKYNAKVAENQAKQVEMDAAESIRRKRKENKRLLATQRGRYAKAGVVMEGTPLELLAESAGNLELEVLDYNRQAQLEQQNLRAQGAMDRAMGSMQARGAYIGAGATLLSGAGQAAGMAAMSGGGGMGRSKANTAAGMEAAGAPRALAVRSGY